jgi:hydroxymethylbilane synthase
VRVKVLSRASDLARLQAGLVGRTLTARWPDLDISFLTRTSAGDRDAVTPLVGFADKGAFTTDLTEALLAGHADLVVHSWKDLPIEDRAGTKVVATLERADPRDVLLVRKDVLAAQPTTLTVLSSSPRRVFLLRASLPALLPWKVDAIQDVMVRGNIPTRLRRLLERRADALVVAKAALDRLLGADASFSETTKVVREAIDQCHWMVLPISLHPSAPAQGALAIEIAASATALGDRLRAINHVPTWTSVLREREILAAHGGGCHAALGATVFERDFGRVTSVRLRDQDGVTHTTWSLEHSGELPPRAEASHVWPRPEERGTAARRALDAAPPATDTGLWVTRAEALPESWQVAADQIVWVSGTRTWQKLAARGIWVHGSADGLGDAEAPQIDAFAGRTIAWRRLTHAAAAETLPDALATYVVEETLPADLSSRTHFFWSSGTAFQEAIARTPAIRDKWHACGPGRTWRVVREILGPGGRVSAWLDYDQWLSSVRRNNEVAQQ